jgi:hypothetical protein
MATEFSVSKTNGYVNTTRFKFDAGVLNEKSYSKFLWDFGDGVRTREKAPSHIYLNPSSYNVKLNAYYQDSAFDVFEKQINVDLLINESIYFDFVPPPTFAGHFNRYPFRVNITSFSTEPHIIDLYANYSRSYSPQDPNNKWTFLRPQWRFLDKEGNQIYQIKTTDTIIRVNEDGKIDQNGLVAGVTGTAEFYFVDDFYNFDLAIDNKPYTTIIATLQTSAIHLQKDVKNINEGLPNLSNSIAQAIVPYIVLWRTPDYLRITENGIREHSNPRWVNSDIPLIINPSFKNLEYKDTFSDGNGVKLLQPDSFFTEYIPYNNTSTVSISAGFYDLSSNISPTPLEFKYIDDTTYKVAGYYKGTFNISKSALSKSLTATTVFSLPNLSANQFNPIMWIPNGASGTLNNVQYIKNPHTAHLYFNNKQINNQDKAIVKSLEMPLVTNPDFLTDRTAITGIHGIECVAAMNLPNYHAWCIDSDLDKMYRVATNGNILCSIDFKKLLNVKFASPAYCALDGDQNIWVTLYDTTSTLKFDSNGNLLFAVQPLTRTYPSTAILSQSQYDIPFKWVYDTTYHEITSNSIDYFQNFINPTGVDTDTKNNAWVTYSNPFSSYVSKISSNGIVLSSIYFPLCTSPQEILCDKNDNVWIALSNNVYRNSNFLQKRNTNGETLSTFGPFNGLNYLTIDINQNPWFTYSYQYIGCIEDGTFKSYKIPLNEFYSKIPNWVDTKTHLYKNSSENLITWSQNFENPYWLTQNILIIKNAEVAPDDTSSGTYIFENNENLSEYNITTSNFYISGLQVASVYLKPESRSHAQLSLSGNSGVYASSVFNLTANSYSIKNGTAGMMEVNNGWYRCYVSGDTTDASNFIISLHDGVSSIYYGTSSLDLSGVYNAGLNVWGAQAEIGTYPTDYIKTSGSKVASDPIYIDVLGNIEETALKGIAFDGKTNIFVLNSLENKLVIFDINKKTIIDDFYINPKGFNFYPSTQENILDIDYFLGALINKSAPTLIEYHPWISEMKVTGDWTGWRWNNKYFKTNTYTKQITGESRKMDFYDKNPFNFFKINENHDLSEQIKSVSFIPALRESSNLFENFLTSIFGKNSQEHLGVVSFEKIANFLKNQHDIDVCDINSLYDLAESIDLNTDDYRLNYPLLIKRLIDLTSINKSKLWGSFDKTSNSFIDYEATGNLNRGNELNTSTYLVSAGTPVVLKTKSLNKYVLVNTGVINSLSTYSLDYLANFIKLDYEWENFYEFFEYVPSTPNSQLEGMIDWTNSNTSLNYNISSNKIWSNDEGILETLFNYELYKGLNLLDNY